MKRFAYTVIIIVLSAILLASCKARSGKELFEEAQLSAENIGEWTVRIDYLGETRGTSDSIYTSLDGNQPAFADIVNSIYGAKKSGGPKDYIFSAEAMCDYKLSFTRKDAQESALGLFYSSAINLLVNVTRETKDDVDVIRYEFFIPQGDVLSALTAQREFAVTPVKRQADIFRNPQEVKLSIEPEELQNPMDEVEFEFYTAELPPEEGTACQLYTNQDIPGLAADQYVIMARSATNVGEAQDLQIQGLYSNQYYTVCYVEFPDNELAQELGIKIPNAIVIKASAIDPEKYIVFVDTPPQMVGEGGEVITEDDGLITANKWSFPIADNSDILDVIIPGAVLP